MLFQVLEATLQHQHATSITYAKNASKRWPTVMMLMPEKKNFGNLALQRRVLVCPARADCALRRNNSATQVHNATNDCCLSRPNSLWNVCCCCPRVLDRIIYLHI